MTIEEEKKLVAEKLMGWEVTAIGNGDYTIYADEKLYESTRLWRINSDQHATCKQWDDIYENMDDIILDNYHYFLVGLVGVESYDPYTHSDIVLISTAKPSIRWEALVKAIS